MLKNDAEKLATEELISGKLNSQQESLMRFIIQGVRHMKNIPTTIHHSYDPMGYEEYECPTCLRSLEENKNQKCSCGQQLLKLKEEK